MEYGSLRAFVALTFFVCLIGAGSAWASGGDSSKPKKSHGASAEQDRQAGPRVPSVSMPKLVAPVIVDGQLHHYVYFSVTLQLADDSHKSLVLEKIPYLQDAFLRDVHASSIALDGNPEVVDEKSLVARLIAVSERVLGSGIVKNIEFKNIAHPTG